MQVEFSMVAAGYCNKEKILFPIRKTARLCRAFVFSTVVSSAGVCFLESVGVDNGPENQP